jgi:hypothetical protein
LNPFELYALRRLSWNNSPAIATETTPR